MSNIYCRMNGQESAHTQINLKYKISTRKEQESVYEEGNDALVAMKHVIL